MMLSMAMTTTTGDGGDCGFDCGDNYYEVTVLIYMFCF